MSTGKRSAREHYFRELVEGKREKPLDRLLLVVLTALSLPYGVVMRLRSLLYSAGLLRSHRLPKPVISVGNLTVGGTGKTPTVAFIARYFLERGKRVAVLSRGYGGSAEGTTRIVSDGRSLLMSAAEAGDEPFLLASTIPGLMVVSGPSRYRAGVLALEQLNPDLFILDDGFQHLALQRDLNILLLDAGNPYSTGRLLPAGLLREPKSAEQRADVVIYTRSNGTLPANAVNRPWCLATHQLSGLVPVEGGDVLPFSSLSGMRVMAFAGIASPSGFFDALEGEGVPLLTTLAFPDHCEYGEEEIAAIVRLRDASRSQCLVTTEKDAVKLSAVLPKLGKVYAARLVIRFPDPLALEAPLARFL